MEGSGTGIGRLDCYEDMFKEITRKLYGEDPDHRSKLKFYVLLHTYATAKQRHREMKCRNSNSKLNNKILNLIDIKHL